MFPFVDELLLLFISGHLFQQFLMMRITDSSD